LDTPDLFILPEDRPFIHESSYVDEPCHIGKRTSIFHFSHIMAHSIIGEDCHIGHNVTIGSGVLIGNKVRVMNNTLLNSGLILEDEVYCGPSIVFTALKNIRSVQQADISKVSPTLVRQGAHISANSTVSAGVTIGRFTFIEAGSVVDKSLPDFALAYGNPVEVQGWRCCCGTPLLFTSDISQCHECDKRYYRKTSPKGFTLIVPIDSGDTVDGMSNLAIG
jgi:UDP-2-acetamido-3-amino-2,3-dideoxy-glucuronate N-acetyltransferase